MDDNSVPEESVVIELPDDDLDVPVEINLAPPPTKKKVDDDEGGPLQKALEAQQRAEDLARTAQRERDEALRQAQQHQEEITKERGEREDAQYNSVLTAIAAETSVLEKAEADYAAFSAAGDWSNAAKAQRLIATAAARIERLDEGKQSFETRREAAKTAAPATPARPASQDFEARISQLPEQARDWLRKHPEFINDAKQNAKIQAAHGAIVELDGISAFSTAYFDALDTKFGFKKEPDPPQQQQRRSMPVSAPVSRDVPSANGTRQTNSVTLSPEERLIARNSFTATDMTNAQKEALYAANKRKLAAMKANGSYRQTTEQTG